MELTERERSLNQTISVLVSYRYQLRTVTENLLRHLESSCPYNTWGEDRVTEYIEERTRIISEAKAVLYETCPVVINTNRKLLDLED